MMKDINNIKHNIYYMRYFHFYMINPFTSPEEGSLYLRIHI